MELSHPAQVTREQLKSSLRAALTWFTLHEIGGILAEELREYARLIGPDRGAEQFTEAALLVQEAFAEITASTSL